MTVRARLVRGLLPGFGALILVPLATAAVTAPDDADSPSGLVAQAPARPSGLRCVAATATTADLVWDTSAADPAAVFVVERAPVGTDRFAPLAPEAEIVEPAFRDHALARGGAYRYRVRARSGEVLGEPSDAITVGAFQPGFAVAAPIRGQNAPAWGTSVDLAVDPDGDPMVAFVHVDPNDDADLSDSVAYFVRWDRVRFRWTEPTAVATGVAGGAPAGPGLALAVDGSGNPHVAFADHEWRGLRLADSADRGATWTARPLRVGEETASFASFDLAISGATAHVVFAGTEFELGYTTGPLDTRPAAWPVTMVPAGGDPSLDPHTLPIVPTLALDASGRPAVVSVTTNQQTSMAAWWRPGQAPESALTSGEFVGDGLSVGLAFRGDVPVVGATLPTSYEPTDPAIHSAVRDAGGWSARTSVAYDGKQWAGGSVSLAANEAGYALIYDSTTGAGENRCGNPKLARSSDGVRWRTCSPDEDNRRGDATSYSRIADSTAGDFYAAWQVWGSEAEGFGVTVWRGN